MNTLRARLPAVLAGFWWASLSTVGFFVVPMLFVHLQPAAVAGNMAARLFTGQTWIGVACGMLLLAVLRRRDEENEATPVTAVVYRTIALVLAGMLLALLAEFAVAPHIIARENLKLWHGVGSAMYLLQWLCAASVFWRLLRPASRS